MNDIKIIFFDIDGTLIDIERKVISEKMIETLQRLKERNIILCIATGRSPVMVPKFDGVDFDAFITFNGSYSFNQKEVIYKIPIPTEDVHKIIENAAAIHRPVALATTTRTAANGRDKDLVDYYAIAKNKVIVAEDFDQVAEEEVYQIMAGSRKEEYSDMLKNVEYARITAWWDRAVDIIPADSGKGTAVAKILEYYHLDKSQAMAFGDGNNDLEMLQAVGHGIAMGNGSSELKEIAEDVCGHVAEDGIYHYCVEKGLI
ncbi:MAG: Cof-type HAD-IIB family hydrolase [Lachnospiraceae bacterium]|nr:Cof-type HAD-IIB family hydrolase [Lachnospiraceae bacterium]